ncbi:MAG TPA: outer membrane lipoprotein-sorting protein [Myxococcota bacterium]|nr:outer membrane lipoprotein-sorting protein [Myxococcota bacterium]
MLRRFACRAICIAMLAFGSHVAVPDYQRLPTATEIMEKVAEQDAAPDFSARAEWKVFDTLGRQRIRESRIYRRDARRDGQGYRTQWLTVLDFPDAVQGTRLLICTREAGGSDQWQYLGAYQQIRRLGPMVLGDTILESTLTFDDLRRTVGSEIHTLLRREEDAAVIESTPRTPVAGYARRRTWVDLRHWTTRRVMFLGADGVPVRDIEAHWKELSGGWLWQQLEITDFSTKRRTVVELSDYIVGTLPAKMFSPAELPPVAP